MAQNPTFPKYYEVKEPWEFIIDSEVSDQDKDEFIRRAKKSILDPQTVKARLSKFFETVEKSLRMNCLWRAVAETLADQNNPYFQPKVCIFRIGLF